MLRNIVNPMVNYVEAEQVEQGLDDLFVALSNDKRRSMVQTLAFRPATIGDLAAENGLSLPAMHKHVKLLERANQFRTEWSGQASLENYIAGLQ
jgi:predicted transcriptional regulator